MRSRLSGVLVYVFGAFYYATAALSLYVAVDSARRDASDFAIGWDRRWFYFIPQALFFAAFVVGMVLPSELRRVPLFGAAMLVAAPAVFAHQMAYLLRIVFPTQKRREARLAAREAEFVAAAGEGDEE